LSKSEQQLILGILHSERFADMSPAQVYATLLDESIYHCSIHTMYRILDAHGEVKERRNQLRHPDYKKPESLAVRPNQVWSWDIERHEVFWNRAVMKGHRQRLIAESCLKLRAA
jgi:hypothetical protein